LPIPFTSSSTVLLLVLIGLPIFLLEVKPISVQHWDVGSCSSVTIATSSHSQRLWRTLCTCASVDILVGDALLPINSEYSTQKSSFGTSKLAFNFLLVLQVSDEFEKTDRVSSVPLSARLLTSWYSVVWRRCRTTSPGRGFTDENNSGERQEWTDDEREWSIHYDWLIIYCFTSHSGIFHLYGDFTIAGEELQNLAYAWSSGPLSREGSLSCHTCCDTGPRFFWSYPKNHLFSPAPLTTQKSMWMIWNYNRFWAEHFKETLVPYISFGAVLGSIWVCEKVCHFVCGR
jgi:hypothetical protein